MAEQDKKMKTKSALIIGASQGLGEAIVEAYVAGGAKVVGTVREDTQTLLLRSSVRPSPA